MIDYTLVGQIISTHGIKGGLRAYPYTFDINRFFEYGTVYLGEDKVKVEISQVSLHQNIVILYFEGYEDINEVLAFKDLYIYIRRDQEAVLEEGTYYIDDLRQCQAYDTEGRHLGHLSDVIKGHAADVYEIRDSKGYYLVPAVSVFIKEVDIENQKIIVQLIEGMYNEN